MQVPYFIEDLNPLPSARPEKISYPLLGPDQSRFRDRVQSDNRSGCQICHDAVRIDNWFKTTAQGRLWEMLHGRATKGGCPTDEALRFFERRAFPLNSPKPQNVWP
jgi:hypothetical protein